MNITISAEAVAWYGAIVGIILATRLLTSFIYAFAGLSAVVFLYAFRKAQS